MSNQKNREATRIYPQWSVTKLFILALLLLLIPASLVFCGHDIVGSLSLLISMFYIGFIVQHILYVERIYLHLQQKTSSNGLCKMCAALEEVQNSDINFSGD